ncbi:ATP-dependent zinc metalloprotease FtsH isoform X13 [Amyelois transitella]|uniref:ATP-dependent zinc metalloprotease FtsH isoform X12 n=1 Tax=Amyelois transitella TaxID=680683 RepID=UPI00298F4B73|nr:ATP-dependent zinc metalloprotease FtsH isoform X12 [Amyelois transitella]XP_060805594.1 ATP-dependent zinc metalloprotease FtsH isoform X13 [Amyelois transitella]
MKAVAILFLASLAMGSSQEKVHIVDNAPGQNYGTGNIVDPGFYQPSNPNLGTGQIVDPGFYQPSNPNLGTGQIVDPGFYQPSGPSYPAYPPSLYPNPGYPPINNGPAYVENPPPPHWSQTLYPSGVARDANN